MHRQQRMWSTYDIYGAGQSGQYVWNLLFAPRNGFTTLKQLRQVATVQPVMTYFRIAAVSILLAVVGSFAVIEGSEERRDRQLQPERVLDALSVTKGMTVGEVGAGRGYFALKLARRVGPGGHVYANDIDSDVLETLSERCDTEKLNNVTIVHGDVDHPHLPVNRLDMVFLVYALHDFSQPVEVLKNLRPSLRAGGIVVVLDQDPEITDDDHFLSSERVIELFGESGYRLIRREHFLERDLLMVFASTAGKVPRPPITGVEGT